MGRVSRGQDRFIRRIPVILTCGCLEARTGWDGLAGDRAGSYAESLSFSPVAAWRQGQDGTGWQGTGPALKQSPCHSHLWLLGGRDRMGQVGRGQGPLLSRVPVILTCGCLEAGTGWDGLAGDRACSYAESLFAEIASFSPVAAWRLGQDGTDWQGTGPAHKQSHCRGNALHGDPKNVILQSFILLPFASKQLILKIEVLEKWPNFGNELLKFYLV
jgi:hypothetical protein